MHFVTSPPPPPPPEFCIIIVFNFSWVLQSSLACIASVSARVRRESWDESKKRRNDGGGGGEWRNSIFFFFCSRSSFRAITRLETLATQARQPSINKTSKPYFYAIFCGLKPAITFIDHFYFQFPLKQKVSIDQVHYMGSMDLDPGSMFCPYPKVLRRISALWIINIFKIAILQTKFGHHFSVSI